MNQDVLPQSQQTYIPAVAITTATLKHSLGKVPVATSLAPHAVCGEARRIGYTGKGDIDFALYRLKIKYGQGLPTVTLPGLYIIEGGYFLEYQQWCREKEDGHHVEE